MDLPDGEAHVWSAELDLLHPGKDWRAALRTDEQQRADRFHFDTDRNRFVTARGILRHLLSVYTSIAPSDIVFSYNPSGKPALQNPPDGVPLHFNISHTRGIALLAFARCPVGVDIEFPREDWTPDYLARMAKRFFHARETEQLTNLPPAGQREFFFRIWTRKEALVKAQGLGLWQGLDIDLSGDCSSLGAWSLTDLETFTGYAAALALKKPAPALRLFQME